MAYDNLGAYGAFLAAGDRNRAADLQGLQQGMLLTQMGQSLEQARKRSMLEQMAQMAGGDPAKLMQGYLQIGDAEGAARVAGAAETMRKLEEGAKYRDVLTSYGGGQAPAGGQAQAPRSVAFRAPDEIAADGIPDPGAARATQVATGRAGAIQGRIAQLSGLADALRQKGLGQQAPEFDKQAQELMKLLPKFNATTQTIRGPDGRPKLVQINDAGEILDTGLTPAEKLHFANLGAKIVGVDQYTGQQVGPGMTVEQSPDSRASGGAQYARLAFDRQQAERPVFAPEIGAFVTRPTAQNPTPTAIVPNDPRTGVPMANPRQAAATVELRKEFAALPEVKAFKEVVPVLEGARKAPNSSQGDIALIYAVGKIMDPESVVREGEMNLIIKSGSPSERISGMVNYLGGGGRLTPGARANLLKMLDTAVGERTKMYDAARQSYGTVAQRIGIPQEMVFAEIPRPQAGAPAPDPGGIPRVTNDAEYALIPKGSIYVAPDGKSRVKQ